MKTITVNITGFSHIFKFKSAARVNFNIDPKIVVVCVFMLVHKLNGVRLNEIKKETFFFFKIRDTSTVNSSSTIYCKNGL